MGKKVILTSPAGKERKKLMNVRSLGVHRNWKKKRKQNLTSRKYRAHSTASFWNRPPHLVRNIRKGDVVVDFDRLPGVLEQIHDVSHGRGHPPTALVVELAEAFGDVGVGVGGGRVLDAVASLQKERAQPSIFACGKSQR